jgi:hypothetical protein
MVDPTATAERIETRDDLDPGEVGVFEYWQGQEDIAEKDERKWIKKSREIIKRYRDERPDAANAQNRSRFNILWSNVQTLLPTLYGRTPKPDVVRRFLDADPTARMAATLLERCLAYSIDAASDEADFDAVMESVVEDRLLPGRGVARVVYVPHFGDEIGDNDPIEEEDEFQDAEEEGTVIDTEGDEPAAQQAREVVYEEVIAKYVFWEDYREGPARTWQEVPWVRFQAYLTRDELVERFGKKGKQVNLDYTPKGQPDSVKLEPPPDLYKKAIVREYWDKLKKQVVWIAPGTPDMVLDTVDDPLRLPGFFPNPDPLRSTTTNDKRTPVPDYIEYQDQARELDRLTGRIDKLTRALKVSGVYAGDEKQVLQQLVDEGTDNRLIPLGDLPAWTDKGGIKGLIEWMPIQQVAETLLQLYNARDRVKNLLYEITGIGDIMRGMTEPDETLGAQELKANFSTRRISPQQRKVGKFARNMFRLMAAVIAEHFSAKTISMVSGYPKLDPVPPVPPRPVPPPQVIAAAINAQNGAAAPQPGAQGGPSPPGGPGAAPPPPDPAVQAYQQQMAQWQQAVQQAQQVQASNQQKQQQFDAAVALIKQDGVHGFRIDIEADSTIAPDEQAEKRSRVEFMQQFVPFMQQIVPMAMGNPSMAQLAEEMTLFTVRGFKVARPLEESITKAFQVLAQMPPPQQQEQGGAGVDSPADLAVRSKQVDAANQKTNAQVLIAREKNAVEMAKLGQQSQTDASKIAAQEAEARARMTMDQAKLADESAFRAHRAEALQAREAQGLT